MKYVSVKGAVEKLSISRATIYREIENGRLPKPVKISKGRVAFIEEQLDQVCELKNQGADEEQVKALIDSFSLPRAA